MKWIEIEYRVLYNNQDIIFLPSVQFYPVNASEQM